MSCLLASPYILWPACAISLCSVIVLILNPRKPISFIERLGLKVQVQSPVKGSLRRSSTSKSSETSPVSHFPHASVFPPDQRPALQNLVKTLPAEQKQNLGSIEITDNHLSGEPLLGWEEDFSTAVSSKYTCSGLSVRAIKGLGDFPDYATLTGVPLPSAYKEFDIDRAVPRPYRPIRWVYHQNMSLMKLEVDWWIELENTYRERMQQRKELYEKHGEAVMQWLPGSELACKETMEMVVLFVCARYPQYFTLSEDKKVLENKILHLRTMIDEKHPLLVLFEHIPEDFAIMSRHPDTGYYHFRAGLICSAIGWNTGTKIGKQLHEIHAPIPDYKEKMKFSMDRFFTKMPCDKPIQRGSWGLEIGQPLFAPPGDPYEDNKKCQSPHISIDDIHLRVDWQTLRRLPLSGSIVFNFKALFTPVTDFRNEAHIPSLFLKIMNDSKKNLIDYKNTWHVEHVVKPALEDYERDQIDKGIVEKGWEPKTLDESPFFPNWQEKWHAQQGF